MLSYTLPLLCLCLSFVSFNFTVFYFLLCHLSLFLVSLLLHVSPHLLCGVFIVRLTLLYYASTPFLNFFALISFCLLFTLSCSLLLHHRSCSLRTSSAYLLLPRISLLSLPYFESHSLLLSSAVSFIIIVFALFLLYSSLY